MILKNALAASVLDCELLCVIIPSSGLCWPAGLNMSDYCIRFKCFVSNTVKRFEVNLDFGG